MSAITVADIDCLWTLLNSIIFHFSPYKETIKTVIRRDDLDNNVRQSARCINGFYVFPGDVASAVHHYLFIS